MLDFQQKFLPFELVFNPNWWYKTAGICFDQSFYLDSESRIENDITMRKVLYQRFGSLGLGEPNPQPRPIIGSEHIAGGFVIPALLGAEILFAQDEAPQAATHLLTEDQINRFEKPDFRKLWPMTDLIQQMDALEEQYGYLVGDVNTDGLLNSAYYFLGQSMFTDMYEAPERLMRFLGVIGDLICDVAEYFRSRTGTCSIAVNRSIVRVNPGLFVHANCTVQMISPRSYKQIQLPVEKQMARRMSPFAIHHCGNNMHKFAPFYAELSSEFFDVGWGSDIAACRAALPNAFLNLRLNPVRMLTCTPSEIAADTEFLLRDAGPYNLAGVCCINMDFGTPEENIFAAYEVIQKYRQFGA
jgi:uroporphyrinogen-III decarboxylase